MMKRFLLLASLLMLASELLPAQPSKQYVTVYAEPDHPDWVYACGESARFTLYAVKENVRMPLTEIAYSYGPEKLKAEKNGTVTTDRDGYAHIRIPGRRVPGFTTVNVSVTFEGKRYTGMTNIGFDPERIEPTTSLPAYFPAFCDVTGYYYGRSGGWPHLFIDRSDPLIEQKVTVSKYYDVVNFARFLTQPGFYAWGFNDIVCCPSSTFSAYNVITAPKTLRVARDTGHWLYPWQTEEALHWLKTQFAME